MNEKTNIKYEYICYLDETPHYFQTERMRNTFYNKHKKTEKHNVQKRTIKTFDEKHKFLFFTWYIERTKIIE